MNITIALESPFNFVLVSRYIDIFGYVQFGGIFVTPIVGLIFDKDRIGKADEMLIISEDESKLQSLRKCVMPFAVTNILCILFCIVSSIQNLKLQVILCNHESYFVILHALKYIRLLRALQVLQVFLEIEEYLQIYMSIFQRTFDSSTKDACVCQICQFFFFPFRSYRFSCTQSFVVSCIRTMVHIWEPRM